MLRHLWVDTPFADGTTARALTRLPQAVQDPLRELDTLGRRSGGLHAASGTLPSGGGESVRLAVLSIILASKGLPEALPQAQFCMSMTIPTHGNPRASGTLSGDNAFCSTVCWSRGDSNCR
jgi:hypothetical protein